MHLSRVQIKNFRNLAEINVPLSGNVVILGENRVGKSNFLLALRLVLDASLPDSARQLKTSDIWDGAFEPQEDGKVAVPPIVEIHLDFSEFENSPQLTSLLTDHRLADDPHTSRLSYVFRPKDDAAEAPTESDYEFLIYGGGDESRDVPSEVRRRICLDVLPALRDAEGDLSTWRHSPLRPLLEAALAKVPEAELAAVSEAINNATDTLVALEPITELQNKLRDEMKELSGERHDIRAMFGFAPTDASRLFRGIRVLIDDGKRLLSEASLGSANLALLSLKLAEFEWRRLKNERNFTLLGLRLIQTQNAIRVARATAERKLRASLS